jgi:hypothetical protein
MDIENFTKQHCSILQAWANSSGTETFVQFLEEYKKSWAEYIQQTAYESFNGDELNERKGTAAIKQTIIFLRSIDRIITIINEFKTYE